MELMILWTDALIYVLVIAGIWGAYALYKNPIARSKWHTVFQRPVNVISAVILAAYIVLGLLDCIHLKDTNFDDQNTSGMVSVLDIMLQPLADHNEKTYSAPFATHLFTKESVSMPDGKVVRDYPKLTYGGAHLKAGESRLKDILQKSMMGLLKGSIISAALIVIIMFWSARKNKITMNDVVQAVMHGEDFPWKSLLITMSLIVLLAFWLGELMPYYHILGTNEVGVDVLYSALKSIRTGLIIGTLTTFITLPFAILFGIAAGYFKGKTDDLIQYSYTTLSSIPAVLLIAAAVMTLQLVFDRHPDWFQTASHRADARLLALCAILGVTSWTGLCRLLRAETLKLTEMDFVQAARVLGVSHLSIITKHLIPNVFHIIIITVILDFSGLVLAEAVLSYVGVGVDPSSFSWGTMINSARLEMARVPVVWWSLASAFIFMFVLVLAANIFSDAVRDAYDPRLQTRGGR